MRFMRTLRLRIGQRRRVRMFEELRRQGEQWEALGPSEEWLLEHGGSHAGEMCFIIGNGPSLSLVPPTVLARLPSFGTNGVFLHFTPTYFVTISKDYYRYKIEEIRALKCRRKFIRKELGLIVTGSGDESLLNCISPVAGIAHGKPLPIPMAFSRRPDRVVYLGGTVLFVCMQLAYWLGFKGAILVGVDHNFNLPKREIQYGGTVKRFRGGDDTHFSQDYVPDGATLHYDVLAMERAYRLACVAFANDGRTIVNATPNTSLDVFPQVALDAVLDAG